MANKKFAILVAACFGGGLLLLQPAAEAASASCWDWHEQEDVNLQPDKHRGGIQCDWVGANSLARVHLDMKFPVSDSNSVWFNSRYKSYYTGWKQGYYNDVTQQVKED